MGFYANSDTMQTSFSIALFLGAHLYGYANIGVSAFLPPLTTSSQLLSERAHRIASNSNEGIKSHPIPPIPSPTSQRKHMVLNSSKNSHEKNQNDNTQSTQAAISKVVTCLAISMTFFVSAFFGDAGLQSPSFIRPPEASAAVAPLADVGVREFLVKDGKQFLRLGLPTSFPASENPEKLGDTGRVVQESVELVRLRLEQVGFSGKTTVWNAALKEVNTAKSLIGTPGMIKGITQSDGKNAMKLVDQTKAKLDELTVAVRNQDITSTLALQEECGALVGEIRSLSLTPGTLPYSIPAEYANLPQLRGRATVTCKLVRNPKAKKPFVLLDGTKTTETTLTMIIDGFHSPITSGNFVDLALRKFYDNMPIESVGDLIVQTGTPPKGSTDGFVDPVSRGKRTIPLELFYKKDKEPTYGYTSDDDMRATESFVTPFQAYGALGMNYNIEDEEGVNSGSSEFWFLKWDQALVAPSRNTLDGSHACFGYVVDGADILGQVNVGDFIEYMRVVEGEQNLFTKK